MKNLILTVVLTAALSFSACTSKQSSQPIAQQQSAVITEKASRADSHECGAATKAGHPCTRKVANREGKDAKCFQHRG